MYFSEISNSGGGGAKPEVNQIRTDYKTSSAPTEKVRFQWFALLFPRPADWTPVSAPAVRARGPFRKIFP